MRKIEAFACMWEDQFVNRFRTRHQASVRNEKPLFDLIPLHCISRVIQMNVFTQKNLSVGTAVGLGQPC